jgi:uncharacterized protein with HEPN domain
MRDIRARLQDILDAISKIESQQPKGKTALLQSELLQVWMVHYLMRIGEAVRSIDSAFKQRHSSVPWRPIAGMRNILVHDYFRINGEIVRQTIDRDIPPLKQQILAIMQTLLPEPSA